ncbi:hypothetical protein M3Y98_00066700 [Aphelenchoides besseyi]|nr:hypothetical protein M3Y98_00066700 [Aphelenchoides besseyi]KAI6198799.1 hypothetical protein M3Y96_00557700 [Aphelenchoides besseyi]
MKLTFGCCSTRKDSCLGGLHIHRGAFLIGIALMAWHICNFIAGIYSICTTAIDPSIYFSQTEFAIESKESPHPDGHPLTNSLSKLIERANVLTQKQNELSERALVDRIGTLDELFVLQREMRELLSDIDIKKTQLATADEASAKWDRKFTVVGVLLTLLGFLFAMFMTFGNYTNQTSFYKPYLIYEPLIIFFYFVLATLFVSIISVGVIAKNELQKHTDMSETAMVIYGFFFAVIGALRLYGYFIIRQSRNLLLEAIDLTV